MEEYILGNIEGKFAKIIWDREPITTYELAKICEKELGWKRTTMYTVLKKLSERRFFVNQNGTVTSLISREEFYARQSEHYVDSSFAGSRPSFLAAFTSRKKLTGKEIAELKKLINNNNNNSK